MREEGVRAKRESQKSAPPDLEEFRVEGHRLVDQATELLASIEDRALFPQVEPAELDALFEEAVPSAPTPLRDAFAELEAKLLPYCVHVNHPGYMGLITPSPTPAGILGDFLASVLNQNLGLYTVGPSAIALERRVVRWLNDLIGYGPTAGGNLTSGGMMANFLALKLARDAVSGDQAQRVGVREACAVYTSEERHISVDKAVDAVGLGREGLRVLPTDDSFRLRLDALEAAISRDRGYGVRPVCIVAMGGSTNTGAVDDLVALRRVADQESMWLHVDAAYGGGMLISRESPGVLRSIEVADSVTIDPHKWFFAPLDAGAVLVRDERRLTESFGLKPAYLTDPLDPEGDRYLYYEHGFEQSRRFRGLKVWLGFKRYGTVQLAAWIDANVRHARLLYELAVAHPDFEPALYPPMSAVCIRYLPFGADEADSARHHAQVARRVEESGRFWITTTLLQGKAYFRVNPVNFRTRTEHMEALFALLVRACEAVVRR